MSSFTSLPASDIIASFLDALKAAGLETRDKIDPNGKLHRFHVEGDRKGSRNGWYVLHIDDGKPNGLFGCHKRYGKESLKWSAKGTSKLSREERAELRARIKADTERRAREEAERQAAAAARAVKIWNAASEVPEELAGHPYLARKGVLSHGLRRAAEWIKEWVDPETGEIHTKRVNDALLVPLYLPKPNIVSLQAIFPDRNNALGRDKDFVTDGRKAGAYFSIGAPAEIDGKRTLLFGEGYATCATAYAATGIGAIVCFDCGNLLAVAKLFREKYPDMRLVFIADNDQWTTKPIENPGIHYANQAARAVGGDVCVAVPIFADLSTKPTDFNDLGQLEGADTVKGQILAAIRGETPPAPGSNPNRASDMAADILEPSRIDKPNCVDLNAPQWKRQKAIVQEIKDAFRRIDARRPAFLAGIPVPAKFKIVPWPAEAIEEYREYRDDDFDDELEEYIAGWVLDDPVPADFEPASLDPKDPRPSARQFLAGHYSQQRTRTIRLQNGDYYVWNGTCWREADPDVVKAQTWGFLERALEDETGLKFKPNRSKVGEVWAALESETVLHRDVQAPAWLSGSDRYPPAVEMMPCGNGLLHLPTKQIMMSTPLFWSHNAVDFPFRRNAPEPVEWLRFLETVWPEDRESIDTLQEIFGYLLTADKSQQKIFLIVGPPRSGKGTIATVLTKLLGDGNVSNPTLASICETFGLEPLIGKSLALINDARIGSRQDQAQIAERLLNVSGNDAIDINRKYKKAWTGRLGARIIIMTNELPHFTDASGALPSRLIVLQMKNSFLGKEDISLIDRLIPELPGILNWAIEGWARLYQRRRFVQPASAAEAIADLEAMSSPVGSFVKECCVLGATRSVLVDALYDRWKAWCEKQGMQAGTKQKFGKSLKAAFATIKRKRLRIEAGSEEREKWYAGIDMRDWDATGRGPSYCSPDSESPI
jgi:putative DNA primase/helicase